MSAWIDRWQGMGNRQRAALIALGLLGAGLPAYQVFYRPRANAMAKARSEWRTLRQQVEAMQAALPDLEQEQRMVDQKQQAVDRLREDLKTLEAGLPSAGELGQVIQELSRQTQGLQVAFESIKQQLKEDAEHPEAVVEMTLAAPYEDAITYLRRVEQLSPFLRAATVELSDAKAKESAGPGPRMKVVLVTPLRMSTEIGTWTMAREVPTGERLAMPRSPFASTQRPRDQTKRQALKVAGITWRGASSTAIINDEVVRIGDQLGEATISNIFPDKVVLSDGQELYPEAFEE